MLPDGRVAWWRDATGDERGALVAVAVRRRRRPSRSSPSCPRGGSPGCRSRPAGARSSVEVDGDYRVYVVEPDGTTRELASSLETRPGSATLEPGAGGGLSADGTLVVHLAHASTATSCTPRCGSSTSRRAPRSASSRTTAATCNPPPGRPSRAISGWRSRASSATSSGRRSGTWRRDARSRPRRRPAGRRLPGAVVARRRRCSSATSSRAGRSCSGSIPTTGATTALTDLAGDIDAARHPARRRRSGIASATRCRPPRIVDDRRRRWSYGARRPPRPRGARTRAVSRRTRTATGSTCSSSTPDGDGPFPTVLQHPRRPRVARTRPVRPRDPGVRRRRVRGRARELPRVDRLRRRVPRGADRPASASTEIRGHPRVSRRA